MSYRHGKSEYVLPIRKVVLEAIAIELVALNKKTVTAQQSKDYKSDYPWLVRNQINWYVKQEQAKALIRLMIWKKLKKWS